MTPKYLKIRIVGKPQKNEFCQMEAKKKKKNESDVAAKATKLDSKYKKLQSHENIRFNAWKSLKFSFFPWIDDIVDESVV